MVDEGFVDAPTPVENMVDPRFVEEANVTR
jgi:hypothetical protein